MAFTQEKFQQLRPETRAKKCSDLLRELLIQPSKDWKVKLREYHQLALWAAEWDLSVQDTPKATNPLPKVAPETLWSRELVLAYEFWRKLSGLGLEERIYSALNFTDDAEDKAERIPWVVWCHNLRSAHNVGSIIRTADCFGWSEIWISGYTADASNKAIQSAAMGSQAWQTIRYFEDEQAVLDELKDSSSAYYTYPLYALETAPDAPAIHELSNLMEQKQQSLKSGILVLGNEEFGISENILAHCDQFIQIPMYGRKTSLNVANAFAVSAHQIRLFAQNV